MSIDDISLGFAVAAAGLSAFAALGTAKALMSGKIRVRLNVGPTVVYTRWGHTRAYWFFVTVSAGTTALLAVFAYHFGRDLI